MLPYTKHEITNEDIEAVTEVMRRGALTKGSKIEEFEAALCAYTGCKYAVVMSSGTAALHAAAFALETKRAIVPAMSFVATANCARYVGAEVSIVDVEDKHLHLDKWLVNEHFRNSFEPPIGNATVITCDFAGVQCPMSDFAYLKNKHGFKLLVDGCHSFGIKPSPHADITCYSFHPAKLITTGEGGVAVTNNSALASHMRKFRDHGISTSQADRDKNNQINYDVDVLGFNYRMTDIQATLGLSQLKRAEQYLSARKVVRKWYDENMLNYDAFSLLDSTDSANHLCIARFKDVSTRDFVYKYVRRLGVMATLHYPVISQFTAYKGPVTPVAQHASDQILSLPLFPAMTYAEVAGIVSGVRMAITDYTHHSHKSPIVHNGKHPYHQYFSPEGAQEK